MNAQQVYTDIQALSGEYFKIAKKEPGAIANLSRVYQAVYGGDPICATCSNKHIKAIHQLQSLTLENLTAMSNRKYKIKDGELIQFSFDGHAHFSNHNLTDKAAEAYLAENPEGIKYFSEYPEQEKKESKKKADKAE